MTTTIRPSVFPDWPCVRLVQVLLSGTIFLSGGVIPGLADQPPPQYDYAHRAEPFKVEHSLSRIGVTNDLSEHRPQSDVDSENAEVGEARRKLRESIEETKAQVRRQFCDQPPYTELCARVPRDNTDFSELFVYMFILDTAQNSFDIFSWQSFVAMNWPLEPGGEPSTSPIGTAPGAARVWSAFETPAQLFGQGGVDPVCSEAARDGLPVLRTSTFLQTGGYPLIDGNLNYVIYDQRVNDIMAGYIRASGLDSLEGQISYAASGRKVDFPMGYYDDPAARTGGARGSAALKSAWKIVDTGAGDDPSKYFTMRGLIAVDAAVSETGEAFCVEAELGLIGMHIMQRNLSGNGGDWTWSTFEHVDNAPDADNARKPIDTLHDELFAGGCAAPAATDREYALYKPGCEGCKTNYLESAAWKWSPTRPHAESYAASGYGSQVVRCWKIFEGTALINELWQEKLGGTVWANYQASSAQWKGAKKSLMFPQGEVPRFLVNTTMETYDQASASSSCLGCHADARTAAGQPSNLSFVLNHAGRFSARNRSSELSTEQ